MNKCEMDTAWEKRMRALAYAVLALEQANSDEGAGPVRVTECRCLLDRDNRTSVLLIVKGLRGDEKLVAFVGGLALTDALLALVKKLRAGALGWREDRPWAERGG